MITRIIYIVVLSVCLMIPSFCSGQLLSFELDFYSQHSKYTDPVKYAYLYKEISDDPADFVNVIQNVLLHGGLCWAYNFSPLPEQKGAHEIRKTEDLLQKILELDNSSLKNKRPLTKRILGNCRTFAVLFCSLCREKKIPARVRSGYSTYTWGQGMWENHWACEYWDKKQNRWILADAQIDDIQRKLMNISFNTMDLPEGKFIFACDAYLKVKKNEFEVKNIGLGSPGKFNSIGWPMLSSDIIRDFLALNKIELLPWDMGQNWGKTFEDLSADGFSLLDSISAAAANNDSSFFSLQALYLSRTNWYIPE